MTTVITMPLSFLGHLVGWYPLVFACFLDAVAPRFMAINCMLQHGGNWHRLTE